MSGPLIPMNRRDLLFLDTETSGLDPIQCEILDLAAVRVKYDFSLEIGAVERKCRMQFPDRAEPKALEINKYSEEEWKDALPIRVALIDFSDIVGDGECIVVGHNPHFDWGFLREAYRREGLKMPDTKYLIDTASLAWPLCARGYIERINLEAICKTYGIPNVGAHRAMVDVRRTMLAYQRLLGMAA